MTPTELQIALSKAKIRLMARPDSVFFTTLCFSLKHEFEEEGNPTAYTDRLRIVYNPHFFMGLTPDERVFLLLHETMHVAYMHPERCTAAFDHDKANKAMDYVINLQLHERGFIMPKDGLLDLQYAGLSWEQVYKLLPDDPTPPPMKDVRPGKDPSKAEEHAKDLQDILVRATTASKMAGDVPGTIPGDIQIFQDKLLNPKLPTKVILQRYMRAFDKSDYSWRMPNRRFMPKHYLPSLYGEALGEIAIAVDASGSVSDSDFLRFISEIMGIVKSMKPKKISLITFDTKIRSVDPVRTAADLLKVNFTGRGGTNIKEVIEWTNANKPLVLLLFTDGEFHFPTVTTKTPVVWLIHDNTRFSAPYGKTIHYEV